MMRYFLAGLIGLTYTVAIFISAVLVVRYLPLDDETETVETSTVQETTVTPPTESPESATPKSDPAASEATSSLPAPTREDAKQPVSPPSAEGEQIVAEFVPTIPPPVPPNELLEIVPGGILNFRSLPPEARTQERPTQLPPQTVVAPATRAAERLRLTPEQAEKVRDVLLSHTIMQSEHEFPIRVGGTVPQNIELTPLPREVASAVPGYASYSYVFTQNQLVIVITTSRQIDLLIPA